MDDRPEPVYVTAGLVGALLDRARAADPRPANVVLDATPASEFRPPLDIPDDAPVLSHLYLPEAGRSVRAVFGVDLGRPSGRGTARFVSHPQGPSALTREALAHCRRRGTAGRVALSSLDQSRYPRSRSWSAIAWNSASVNSPER